MPYIGKIPENLCYTKEHEWVKVDGGIATAGITDYAQHALTDVVFVELPGIGKKVRQFKQLCVIESVKSVSDVFSPVSGEVAEINNEIGEKPELVNQDPYGSAWIAKIRISDGEELNNLMDSRGYRQHLEGLGH